MQTKTVKDQLQSVYDELKTAATKHGEEAKGLIRTAYAHAQETKDEIQAKLKEQNVLDKLHLETTLKHLLEVSHTAKAAIDAKGEQVEKHLKESIAAAKAALEK